MSSTSIQARSNGKQKRVVGGLLIGGLALGLGATGLSTYNNWNDDAKADGVVITNGNLEVDTALGGRTITDQFDHNVTTNFRAVPGDTVTLVQPIDVALEGDHMEATLSAKAGGAATNADVAAAYDVTYQLLDAKGVAVPGATAVALGTDSAVTLVPSAAIGKTVDGTADFQVKMIAKFKDTTVNRDVVQKSFDGLSGMQFDLVQKAPKNAAHAG